MRTARAIEESRPAPPAVDAEHAWKTLGLVNDWIRHADAKAGATLAAAGVIGGLLFTLVEEHPPNRVAGVFAAIVCSAASVLAIALSALALLPRLRRRWWKQDDPTSPLYFDHIARAHEDDPLPYAEILAALTSSAEATTHEIALQIHANAGIARRKYRHSTQAVLCLVIALLALAGTAGAALWPA